MLCARPPVTSPLSLPDALRFYGGPGGAAVERHRRAAVICFDHPFRVARIDPQDVDRSARPETRSEQHTSEPQAHHEPVCRHLPEKKTQHYTPEQTAVGGYPRVD